MYITQIDKHIFPLRTYNNSPGGQEKATTRTTRSSAKFDILPGTLAALLAGKIVMHATNPIADAPRAPLSSTESVHRAFNTGIIFSGTGALWYKGDVAAAWKLQRLPAGA